MEKKFFRAVVHYFLKLYDNVPLVLKAKDSRFYILWANSDTSFSGGHDILNWLERADGNRNVKQVVPILYLHLNLPPSLMGERYIKRFSTVRSSLNNNIHLHAPDVDIEAALQIGIVEFYSETDDATVQAQYGGEPFQMIVLNCWRTCNFSLWILVESSPNEFQSITLLGMKNLPSPQMVKQWSNPKAKVVHKEIRDGFFSAGFPILWLSWTIRYGQIVTVQTK